MFFKLVSEENAEIIKKMVDKIEYNLHPTYKQPQVVVNEYPFS